MEDLSKTYYQIEQFLSDLESKGMRVQAMERRTLLAYAEDKEMVALLKQWAAIDVPQFFHFVSLRYSKSRLNDELDLFNTAGDIKDRDSGIAHSSFLNTQMVSAAEFKNALEDTLISWTILKTVFGNLLLVESDYGICKMSFIDEDGFNTEELALEFPFSRLINQQGPNAALVKCYFLNFEKINIFVKNFISFLEQNLEMVLNCGLGPKQGIASFRVLQMWSLDLDYLSNHPPDQVQTSNRHPSRERSPSPGHRVVFWPRRRPEPESIH